MYLEEIFCYYYNVFLDLNSLVLLCLGSEIDVSRRDT